MATTSRMRRHALLNRLTQNLHVLSGLVADVINYAIFENRSQGLGATEPRNMAFHIENVHRPYNSLGTTVPHCDKYSR